MPSWVYAGHPAYWTDHLLPVSAAHHSMLGIPARIWSPGLQRILTTPLAEPASLNDLATASLVVSFDGGSTIRAAALGRSVLGVFHSLVGKGVLFVGNRFPLSLRLAAGVIIPHDYYRPMLPGPVRSSARVAGYIPFSWSALPPTILSSDARTKLTAWTQAPRPRVLLVGTRGSFSAPDLLHSVARGLRQRSVNVGVRIHPRTNTPSNDLELNLAGVPTRLLLDGADVVLSDHSSVAVEARMLGKPLAVYAAPALDRLLAADARGDLAYLRGVPLYRDPEAAVSIALDLLTNPAAVPPFQAIEPGSAADSPAHSLLHIIQDWAPELSAKRSWIRILRRGYVA